MSDKVVIVGAGMGGLVSALLLSQRGVDVTVVESQSVTGGKIHTTEIGGVHIDSGPTVLTMRWVFDEIMRQVGTELDREIELSPLNVLARHFWSDGTRMDLCADPLQSEAEVERLLATRDVQVYVIGFDINEARLDDASARGADFTNTNLNDASLRRGDFTGALAKGGK